MKPSFLAYYKTILTKVSFDRRLFRKEYQKALRAIRTDEMDDFKNWLQQQNLNVN